MSESVQGAPRQVPACEHFYQWLSPVGTGKSARICALCHWPDPGWLSHIIEVDRGHGTACVHCAFADPLLDTPE